MPMTWNEFATIAMALKTAWPSFQIMPTDDSKKVWYSMLSDLDYNICQNSIKRIIATSKYPPSIAEIREAYAECTALPIVDAGEAWGEVQDAIRRYGYYRAEDAMNSLTPVVRQATERIGFGELCHGDNPVANRAHFMKIYDAIAVRERNKSRIPQQVLEQQRHFQSLLEQSEPKEAKASKQEEPEVFQRASPEHIDRLLSELKKGRIHE